MAPQSHSNVQRRTLGRSQHGADLADNLVQRIGLSQPHLGFQLECQAAARRGDFRIDPVAGNLQVSRPLATDHVAQDTVDRLGSGRGIIQNRRIDRHLAEDLQLALVGLDHMMQVDLVITPAKRHLRTTTDDQERRLLGIRTSDRVERVERPGP